jgi:hypothetical protein
MALINGQSYNFANIKIELLGVRPSGVVSINYGLESGADSNFYGLGYEPVAFGYGANTYSASIEFQFEEVQALINAASTAGVPNGDITKLRPFNIDIAFGEFGQPITKHRLIGCRFTDLGVDTSQGQTTLTRAFNILPASIDFAAL